MMEKWDQSNHPYVLLQSLAQVRRNNSALMLGSHQQRYVSESLYAYSRHYRDSHALIIVNQGATSSRSLDSCGLPDGQYSCRISETTVEVVDGKLNHVVIPELSARVISLEGAPVHGLVVGVFQLNGFQTQRGQRLAITGSCPELGEWDHSNSYGMEYVNGNKWIAEVPFSTSAGEAIAYKFLVMRSNTMYIVKNVVSRCQLLPAQGRLKLDCIWNDD